MFHTFAGLGSPSTVTTELLPHFFLFNGPLAVMVFFILSGYSLSITFLQTGNRMRLAKMLAGRYFRLAVPILIACIMVWFLAYTGLTQSPGHRSNASSLTSVIHFALIGVFQEHKGVLSPIPPLWTMPIELLGSFVMCTLLLVCGLTWWRFIAYIAVFCAFMAIDNVGVAAFIVGIVFAEIREEKIPVTWRAPVSAICTVLILPALASTYFIAPLTTPRYLILCVAVAATYSLIASKAGKRFLSSPVSVFLGHISFPLYLLHTAVIASLGFYLFKFTEDFWVKILIDVLVVIVCLIVAWLFRWIDEAGKQTSKIVGNAFERVLKWIAGTVYRRTVTGTKDACEVVIGS